MNGCDGTDLVLYGVVAAGGREVLTHGFEVGCVAMMDRAVVGVKAGSEDGARLI